MESSIGFPQYRELIPDWSAFQECLGSERPEALRVNRIKTTEGALQADLTRQGLRVERSPWFSNLFYWRDGSRPASATIQHWNGCYYIQDPVTLLPVEALELERGETVLDLCAAPGGKALYMAEIVGWEGYVIGNEPVFDRRTVLGTNIQRMGGANVVVTGYDGQSFPERRRFSAILVDAPCSGEATVRDSARKPRRQDLARLRDMARTQYALLEKAYRILEPGGRLVYATCSFAPEENEAVVGRLLDETDARIVSWDRPFPHDPGVTRWKQRQYPEPVRNLWRCYPHHYDGGGMVFGRIERPGEEPS